MGAGSRGSDFTGTTSWISSSSARKLCWGEGAGGRGRLGGGAMGSLSGGSLGLIMCLWGSGFGIDCFSEEDLF